MKTRVFFLLLLWSSNTPCNILKFICVFVLLCENKVLNKKKIIIIKKKKERAIANGQRSFVSFLLLQLSNSFLRILAVPNKAVFFNSPVLIVTPSFSSHASNISIIIVTIIINNIIIQFKYYNMFFCLSGIVLWLFYIFIDIFVNIFIPLIENLTSRKKCKKQKNISI